MLVGCGSKACFHFGVPGDNLNAPRGQVRASISAFRSTGGRPQRSGFSSLGRLQSIKRNGVRSVDNRC